MQPVRERNCTPRRGVSLRRLESTWCANSERRVSIREIPRSFVQARRLAVATLSRSTAPDPVDGRVARTVFISIPYARNLELDRDGICLSVHGVAHFVHRR